MDDLKLSVIVPIYQVEDYLPRCLDSILNQTFHDFELILVNDGTKDNCPRIMEEYAAKDSRIKQIHKQNGGLSSARNAGLEIARGTYISFIDSDDFIAPELFEDALAAAQRADADLVLWNYQKTYDDRLEDAYLNMKDEVLDLTELGLKSYFYQYWFPYKHGVEAWNKLYRRDIIQQNQLMFQPNNEILAEDTLFSAMYLMHTRKIAALSKPYYYYYMRSGSIMNSAKPRAAHRLMTLAVRLCEYAQEKGITQLDSILPVLCYTGLITKGISFDPSMEDIYSAMEQYRHHETMVKILKALLSVEPLLQYTLHTGKGIRMQLRARLFALRWLRGDVKGAVALVHRNVS